jgi:hypothetical protein
MVSSEVVMDKRDWRSKEQGVLDALRQAAELLRVGFRRPWRALLLSALASLALVVTLVILKQDHAPRFVIRVAEADRDPSSMPRFKRQLAEYVREGVLTSQPLFEVMRRHGLYPSLMRKNPRAALESFREDIDVDVYQNYFLETRAARDLPRTARLTISYHSKDAAQALAVTRELGQLVIAHEQAARREQAQVAASDADRERDGLRRALEQRAGLIVAKQTELARSPTVDPRLQVEVVGLLGSVSALELELEQVERRAASMEIGAALESRGMGLYFDVVEDGALPSQSRRQRALLLVAGASFITALPLVAMTLAAFGTRRGPT